MQFVDEKDIYLDESYRILMSVINEMMKIIKNRISYLERNRSDFDHYSSLIFHYEIALENLQINKVLILKDISLPVKVKETKPETSSNKIVNTIFKISHLLDETDADKKKEDIRKEREIHLRRHLSTLETVINSDIKEPLAAYPSENRFVYKIKRLFDNISKRSKMATKLRFFKNSSFNTGTYEISKELKNARKVIDFRHSLN